MAESKDEKDYYAKVSQTFRDLNPVAARVVLLGVDRDQFLRAAGTCYDYWMQLRRLHEENHAETRSVPGSDGPNPMLKK